MREFLRIGADERFRSSLPYIKSRLLGMGAVVENNEDEYVISCADDDRADIEDVVIRALVEITVVDLKFYYITSSIKLAIADEVRRHAFIRALITFDYEDDKMIARALLNLTPTFLIGGFYDFCLDILKERWSEVCALANDNMPQLVAGNTFNELLKFLFMNIDSTCDCVFLKQEGGCVRVLDRDMRPVEGIYVNAYFSEEIKVVSQIVSLAPRKVFFVGEDSLFQKVRQIFDGCCIWSVVR